MYRRKDAYYTRAKAEGYRSRAAYKLLDLQRRYRFLRPGDHVVDLGAWPGAWLQVVQAIVGTRGRVVGVDLVAIDPLPGAHVTTLVGDVREPAVRVRVLEQLGHRPTVVISDMAPKLSGVRARDEVQAADLARAALEFALATLAAGGRFLTKLFTGADTSALAAAARARFATVKLTRPEATRKGSAELYLLATGFRTTGGHPERCGQPVDNLR
jgi:23S rRNA (uridine2552-2'-O)-methyltransferase